MYSDEMVKGAFKSFRHEHYFEATENGTRMTDRFDYEPPFGIIGLLVDFIVLKRYIKNLLIKRNETIKEFAESEKWKLVLK